MERAAVSSGRDFLVRLFGLGPRAVFGEGNHEFEQRVVALQPLQIHLGQRGGRNLARADEFRKLADREKCSVFEVLQNAGRNRRRRGNLYRLLHPLELRRRKHRIEHQRRRHLVGDVQLEDLLVAFALFG